MKTNSSTVFEKTKRTLKLSLQVFVTAGLLMISGLANTGKLYAQEVKMNVSGLVIDQLGLPVVSGGFDALDAVLGDEADVGHAVLVVAEEQHEQVSGAGELLAHLLQAQVDHVLGVVPELGDEFVESPVGRTDHDLIADHVVGSDGDDAPCDGVLAPGGE